MNIDNSYESELEYNLLELSEDKITDNDPVSSTPGSVGHRKNSDTWKRNFQKKRRAKGKAFFLNYQRGRYGN